MNDETMKWLHTTTVHKRYISSPVYDRKLLRYGTHGKNLLLEYNKEMYSHT